MSCKHCGSFAINPSNRNSDISQNNLCDVCYWRDKYDKLEQQLADAKAKLDSEKTARFNAMQTAIKNGTAHVSTGDAEERWIADSIERDCPACGGSGHADDAENWFEAQLMARLGEPKAWRWHGGDEMWRATTCNNKGDMTYLPDGWVHEPLYALSAKEKAE